jgi:hypothetical protein
MVLLATGCASSHVERPDLDGEGRITVQTNPAEHDTLGGTEVPGASYT